MRGTRSQLKLDVCRVTKVAISCFTQTFLKFSGAEYQHNPALVTGVGTMI